MVDAQQNNYTPYFENKSDFDYRLIVPDAKDLFIELNKDLVTTNLKKKDIQLLSLCQLLIHKLKSIGCEDVKDEYINELMFYLNAHKSLDGFFLRRMTEHNVTHNQKFEEKRIRRGIGFNNVGDGQK